MVALNLEQTLVDGRKKRWKISNQKSQLTFGTSRKADIVSIDSSIDAFEIVFEYKGSGWHCIRFGVGESEPDKMLSGSGVISLKNSQLKFEVVAKSEFVLSHLAAIADSGTKKCTLAVVTHNGRLVRSELLEAGKALEIYDDGCLKNVKIPASPDWTEMQIGQLFIRSKTISVSDHSQLGKLSADDLLEKDSRKSALSVLGVTLAVIGIAILVPRAKTSTETKAATRTSAPTVIVKTDLKKKKSAPAPAAPAPQSTVAESSAAGGGKSSALIKSAIGLRISKLLGKVSATEARSKNIIVTANGLKAGDPNAGRALAALGKVESSGRNWTGESNVAGVGVGTAGIGGGKGTSGFAGGLGKGKTGSGGVGLIEEESEITGGLDREIIAQYIKTQLGQILYCYERQLSASPDLFGKIAVRFTIGGTGQVETQTINDTTLKNSSVENCILNKVSKWKFPEPKGGTKVLVTYPFLFKSTN